MTGPAARADGASPRPYLGAVESGGTKVVCLLGTGPDDIVARTRIPTRDPAATLADVVAFFTAAAPPVAVGVASFGPLELRPENPRYGFVTASPKPGWTDVDVVGPLRAALDVPVGIHTDVAGAALGEGRWGAARGLATFVYLTVGTGIGGGAVVGGVLPPGLGHAEMGHVPVPRQAGDTFPGQCPFHGDCLEGMAGGAALAARFGRPAEQLTGADLDRALTWEAGYLAAGLRSVVYTVAPQRVVVGGSVARLPGLLPRVRRALLAELGGYSCLPEHVDPAFVAPAALGDLAGPVGAFVLAERAHGA